MQPKVTLTVPTLVLCSAGVDPKLSELNIFAEGMAIGTKQLYFDAPDPEFMRWMYENHVAAPVEISQKVEVRRTEGIVQGIMVDTMFGEVIVQLDNMEEIAVHPHRVRRVYHKRHGEGGKGFRRGPSGVCSGNQGGTGWSIRSQQKRTSKTLILSVMTN